MVDEGGEFIEVLKLKFPFLYIFLIFFSDVCNFDRFFFKRIGSIGIVSSSSSEENRFLVANH